jgi:U4/U6.U5 tri-snRNP-associated protein 1
MADFPKAAVVEQGGEISCSVQETNRLRAQLGLKPLRIRPTTSAASSDNREVSLSVEESNALRAKLGLKPLRSGPSSSRAGTSSNPLPLAPLGLPTKSAELAEEPAPPVGSMGKYLATTSAGLSAKEWLSNARSRAAAPPPDAPSSAAVTQPQSAHEAVVGIAHGAEDFETGKTGVLTLQDSGLLDDKGRDLASDEALLEDARLADSARALDRQERRSKAKAPVYDPFGEEGGMLSHYDEYEVEGATRRSKRAKLAVGTDGTVVDLEDADAVARRLELAKQGVEEVSLARRGGVGNALQDGRIAIDAQQDTMTREEEDAIEAKLAKKQRRAARKARKAAKTLHTDEDEGILAQLKQQASVSSALDRGTRHASGETHDAPVLAAQTDRELEDALRSEGFAAFHQALHRSRHAQEPTTVVPRTAPSTEASTTASRHRLYRLREAGDDEEDDNDHEMVLARARSLALKRPRSEDVDPSSDDEVDDAGARVLRAVQRISQRTQLAAEQDNERRQRGEAMGAGKALVFTATGEYTKRLGASFTQRAASTAEAQAREQREREARLKRLSDMPQAPPEESLTVSEALAEVEDSANDEHLARGAFGGKEAVVESSMGAALELLRQRGLGRPPPSTQAGRANDARLEVDEYVDQGGEGYAPFRLEYKDKFGRNLTPKQAYRELSYSFHGRAPSQAKQEKYLKEFVRDELGGTDAPIAGVRSAGNSLNAVAASIRKSKGQPFVTLPS